jgi:hypothetical protein
MAVVVSRRDARRLAQGVAGDLVGAGGHPAGWSHRLSSIVAQAGPGLLTLEG